VLLENKKHRKQGRKKARKAGKYLPIMQGNKKTIKI
jgi:hypothetical protein